VLLALGLRCRPRIRLGRSGPGDRHAPRCVGAGGTQAGGAEGCDCDCDSRGDEFRRLHRRFGKKNGGKAAVAIAHDLLVIAWYVLHDGVEFYDLGADYFTRPDSPANDRRKDYLVRELQGMGYTVQVAPAA
jgi:hypothetical protein